MSKCGLVLSGGGAKCIRSWNPLLLMVDGPAELREMVNFDVVSGTSSVLSRQVLS